ncbi:flagellar protein FlaG [Salinibacillus xinjiangensis]|uniref:Flagellar protein FlaG n=1 Tax=Salinibacillus xinjiangensis TaxID=1229268 RepID=A0A6G1X1L8_9BACI|nr:flagellar protein FlaG [Salinibacillus xinjiangensis]MRG84775.1 flagellar protein FlaG [Salinibacillus xinjiangensis]
MDVGKTLSGSQLLQRSQNNQFNPTYRKSTDADGEQIYVQNEEHDGLPLSSEQVKDMTKRLNEFIEPTETSLKFEFHEKLEEYYITIVNPSTKEVIKEIPPKKMLDLYAAMAEFMGFIVDKKI